MSHPVVLQKLQEALAHLQSGRLPEAQSLCREILSIDPASADAIGMLGLIAHRTGNAPVARQLLQRAIQLQPSHPKFHNDLGLILSTLGATDDALNAYQQAISLRPDYAEAFNNLGTVLKQRRRYPQALAAYERATQLKPDFAEAHYNLANVLKEMRQYDRAIAAYRRAIELRPGFSEAYANLANVLKDVGEVEESIAINRQALTIKPDLIAASNLLCTLHYSDNSTAQNLFQEHARWDQAFGRSFARSTQPHQNDRSPNRRIRIGYVSPDLCRHPVGRCLLPVLSNHDHAAFEIVAYSDAPNPDPLTTKLQASTDLWRDTANTSDEQLTELIRRDHIDILVDLASHTNGNRLPVFARKPAPVQVTWLGMPTTTGLSAIDYRISDPYLDPPNAPTAHYSEQTLRLPNCFWCYDRPSETASITPLPAIQNGFITFGCLSNCCKISDATLRLWAGVLLAVPNSRLLLRVPQGHATSRIRNKLAAAGINPDRLDFVDHQPHERYLQTYNRIDIGLDTLAYGGHVTSLDALWMGIPVVTPAGDLPVRRAGVSFCANLSLNELVAQTPEDFVRIAADLSANLPRLATYRSTLRSKLESSPIMNGPQYAIDLETLFRQMWVRSCTGRDNPIQPPART